MLFKHFNYTDKQHGVETVDFRSNYIETRNNVFFIPYNEMYYFILLWKTMFVAINYCKIHFNE